MVNCLVCGKIVSQSGSFVFTRSYCGLSCAIIDSSNVLLIMSMVLIIIGGVLLIFDVFNLGMLLALLFTLGLLVYGRKKRPKSPSSDVKYKSDVFA